MAESTALAESSRSSEEDLRRAAEFAREPFLHEGEDADVVLAPGTPRRRALDDALAELDAGRAQPSVEWRRHYSLMLGLERLLSQEEPHLEDGTTLSAHQVDALSGTLIALLAEAQGSIRANGNGRSNGRYEELPSGEVELEGDEEIGEDEEPVDWEETDRDEDEADEEVAAAV